MSRYLNSKHVFDLYKNSLYLYTTSFVPYLVARRDRGFHIYRQLCLFLFKIGRRCIKPKSLPQESNLSGNLNIVVSDTTALSVSDFIARSKLDQRLDVACKVKAERELSDSLGNRLSQPKRIKESKEELCRLSFHAAQSNSLLTSDTVKGLGSFDLDIMFRAPLEQAIYCFKQLFRSFQLRSYFQIYEESICAEEYLSFLDELRKEMPGLEQSRVIIIDAISFVSGHESLQWRLA